MALSTSGENPFILPHLTQIKQEKNKIVSITNNRQSTIAKISDINIPYYVNEEYYESANITTQFPVLFLLEWMAREVSKHE
ncbi:SIS domain-containing protein [Paenibacillus tundrae]|uniref:SIS domain-containing protein n=1 Tax=Paenibacillus tundrae TaxID=528187 RepID=UPI0027D8AB83|nr:SIS domain-containing protein [Paenibacillus tundrae]